MSTKKLQMRVDGTVTLRIVGSRKGTKITRPALQIEDPDGNRAWVREGDYYTLALNYTASLDGARTGTVSS